MPRNPKHDILFEPVRIGPKMMKNRFYQTPYNAGFGTSPGTHAAFRGMRAEGGWAVVNTEATTFAPEFDSSGFSIQARIWDDNDVRNWVPWCEKVHEHGALAGIELHAPGSANTGFDSRLPAPCASQITDEVWFMSDSYEMDKEEIRTVQRQYVDGAKRARSAGFDIVNIHGVEVAGLPVMFLMKRFNKRTDEYGGAFENRARFWLETLELVREEVGDDCAVAARFCIDTLHGTDEGIRVEEEGIGFIKLADHLVDFWDLQVGGENHAKWMKDSGPSRFYPENFQSQWLSQVRPHTKKPIVGVGRFTNPDTMVEIIRAGQIDIIGAARPSIADPFLPQKIEEGRLDEIRECIGCNVCASRINAGWSVICTQDATAGEEYRRAWHPERFSRAGNADNDVLIVGGGPAAMECAIVLGKRGMRRVHVAEASDDLGGHWRWVTQFYGLGEWARVVNYRKIQIDKLKNVEVITRTHLDAQGVREYGAEIVVIATGARWATDGLNGPSHSTIPGADARLPHVLTPEQIMLEGKEVPGDRVLVYDCEGYFMGASLAEKLAREGKQVTLITPMASIGPYMDYTGESLHMTPLLARLGVQMLTSHLITGIDPREVTGLALAEPRETIEWPVDAVVLVTQRISNDALYRELKSDREALAREGVQALFRIGDCLAPRLNVADAIFDGHRLAREIDSDDPSVALPYIRENRIIGATDSDYESILSSRR